MIDFTKLCREHRIPTLGGSEHHHHSRPGWLQMNCPFCSSGRSGWHLGYNLRTGAFACWRCGALRFWQVVPPLLRLTLPAAKKALHPYWAKGSRLPAPPPVERHQPRRSDIKPPAGTGAMMGIHREYLAGRGFDPEQLEEDWGLMGANHLAGKWAWRIVIPIRNGAGKLVAFQGRAVGPADPKYLMTADGACLENPDTFLYGLDKAVGDSVVVVEGATGVWRLGAGAVGVLGIGWKREQMNRLRRFRRRFVLFDPEPVAQKRALKLAAELALFEGETEIITGFTTDPGELTAAEVSEVRGAAGLS